VTETYDVDNLRQLYRDGFIRYDDEGQVYLDPSSLPVFRSDAVMECEHLRVALEQYRSNLVGSARYQAELRAHCDGEGDRSAQGGGRYWILLRDLTLACGKLDMTAEQIGEYAGVPADHVRRFASAHKYREAMLLVRDHGFSVRAAAAHHGLHSGNLSRWLAEHNIKVDTRRTRVPQAVFDTFDRYMKSDASDTIGAWRSVQDMEGGKFFTYSAARQRVSRLRKKGELPPVGFSTWGNYQANVRI
jgi:ribosomal protein L13E